MTVNVPKLPTVLMQIRHNKTYGLISGSQLFDPLMLFVKGFFENVNFEKNLQNIFLKNITQHAKSILQ